MQVTLGPSHLSVTGGWAQHVTGLHAGPGHADIHGPCRPLGASFDLDPGDLVLIVQQVLNPFIGTKWVEVNICVVDPDARSHERHTLARNTPLVEQRTITAALDTRAWWPQMVAEVAYLLATDTGDTTEMTPARVHVRDGRAA